MNTRKVGRSRKAKAVKFFFTHAGYSWDAAKGETKIQGRWNGARRLAAAEAWAEDNDVTFYWEYDSDGDLGDHEYWCKAAEEGTCQGHEILYCAAKALSGRVLASLYGIIEPDDNYRRVVQAELALESMVECTTSQAS